MHACAGRQRGAPQQRAPAQADSAGGGGGRAGGGRRTGGPGEHARADPRPAPARRRHRPGALHNKGTETVGCDGQHPVHACDCVSTCLLCGRPVRIGLHQWLAGLLHACPRICCATARKGAMAHRLTCQMLLVCCDTGCPDRLARAAGAGDPARQQRAGEQHQGEHQDPRHGPRGWHLPRVHRQVPAAGALHPPPPPPPAQGIPCWLPLLGNSMPI